MICDLEEQRVSCEQTRSISVSVLPCDKRALIGFTQVLLGETRQRNEETWESSFKQYKRGAFVLPGAPRVLFSFISEGEYSKLIPGGVRPLVLHLPSRRRLSQGLWPGLNTLEVFKKRVDVALEDVG